MILEQIIISFMLAYVGGMSCKQNPCMYGVCKDADSSYECYCIDGYTGVNCEINSNDCWSNPCVNGGTCIDQIAHYNCSCPEGLTGEHCEVDVSVCNSELCKNGGECQEEFGLEYSCKCAEGWTGEECESDINECLDSPCQNGGLCINLVPLYICACLFECLESFNVCQKIGCRLGEPNSFTGKNCDQLLLPCETNTCENNALCLIEEDKNVCYCVPDYHGVNCEQKYNNCEQLGIICQNGGTCINDFLSFTCNCLPQYTGRFCTIQVVQVATSTDVHLYITQSSLPYTILTDSARTLTPSLFPTSFELLPTSSEAFVNDTHLLTTDVSPSSVKDPNFIKDSLDNVTTSVGEFNLTSEFDSFPTYESTSSSLHLNVSTETSVEEVSPSTSLFNETSSAYTMWSSNETSSPIWNLSSFQDDVEKGTGFPDFFTNDSSEAVTETTVSTMSFISEGIFRSDNQTKESTKVWSTDAAYTTLPYFTDEFEDTVTPIIYTFEPQRNVSVDVTTTVPSLTSLSTDYCDHHTCIRRNFCSMFGLCKCIDSIRNVGFNGTSYIRHDVLISNNNILLINVTLITKSKNGILLHTLFDNERYALLHLRLGQLQLQLSCGSQKILFGTIDAPINNGYMVYLALSFQYILEEPMYKCIAKLYVNGTVIMSGEQTILSYDILPRNVRLYLGGIPVAVPYYISHASLGFVGCMNSLHVNNIKKNLIRDATEIYQVSNCETFNCFLNPCENSGYCEDVNGVIKCNCLPGFVGKYCEKSVCEDHPCHFGATCITFPGSTFICICPLGKHGLLCEKNLEITVPSFTTILPGLSSYMAFGFKNSVKTFLELSFSIKPLINEQISLIAYLGQSNVRKRESDYFAVTYVQGYIMLTWDLGSGVRRIFTEIPLNVGTRKFYSLSIGRKGKSSWMFIDGIGNVSGSSPGSMTTLDVSPILYLGGHKSKKFEKLPHDLPLHTGFIGCITDIQLRTENNMYNVQETDHVVGRNIGQCDSNECSDNSCNNGAVCLNHGPSYRCICMRGWEGPDCTVQSYVPANTCRLR